VLELANVIADIRAHAADCGPINSEIIEMVDTILRRVDVERATGLKTSSLYEKIKAGEFPRPVKINSRSVGWLASEVADWQQARVAQRDREIAPKLSLNTLSNRADK
jgi:prophage regulatory protein